MEDQEKKFRDEKIKQMNLNLDLETENESTRNHLEEENEAI